MRIGGALHGLVAVVSLAMLWPHQSEAGSYNVIYSFDGPTDGKEPMALLPFNGALYGITYMGGTKNKGTIFTVTPSGKETIVHSFTADGDGYYPTSLIALGGDLFGTTRFGGSSRRGTIFRVTNGKYVIIHSFSGGADGSYPLGLTVFKGTVYGVTFEGGTAGFGTLYKITRKGVKTIIYNFESGGGGSGPQILVADGQTMFVADPSGGANKNGVVYSASATGVVKVIHSFDANNTNDGYDPIGLVAVGGTAYCLTTYGGPNGQGVFVSIAPDGSENLLYSFGTALGNNPGPGMSKIGGLFYGATTNSGETLFSLTAKGKGSVVTSFPNAENAPLDARGGLVDLGGVLYGFTFYGGTAKAPGRGTIYSVGP